MGRTIQGGGFEQFLGERLQDILHFARLPAESQQSRDDLRIIVVLEHRQEFVSKPISRERRVQIGGIPAVILIPVAEPGFDVAPPNIEQRADQSDLGREPAFAGNAPQPGEARAPEDVMQNRLRLVIRGVGQHDVPAVLRDGGPFQKIIPRFSRRLFQGLLRPGFQGIDIQAFHDAGNLEAQAQRLDPAGILGGLFSSQPMIEMGRGQIESEFPPELTQAAQQCHTVGSPGNRHQKPTAFQRKAGQSRPQLIEKIGHVQILGKSEKLILTLLKINLLEKTGNWLTGAIPVVG